MVNCAIEIRKPQIMELLKGYTTKEKIYLYNKIKARFPQYLGEIVALICMEEKLSNFQMKLGEEK